MKKFFFLFLPLWLYGEVVWQQSSNGTASHLELSSTTIAIDQPLELTLRLQFPLDAHAEFSTSWRQDDLSAFNVVSQTKKNSPGAVEIRYLLDPLYSGDIFIHIPTISILKGKQPLTSYSIPPISVSITPLPETAILQAEPLVRADTLHPIEISRENALLFEKPASPQEELAIFKERTFPLNNLLKAASVFALFTVLWFLLRKQRPVELKNSRTTLLRTLQDLELSFGSNSIDPEMYQNLNIKMRQYIQDRYGINAPYLTTEEFLNEASKHENVDANNREILKAFLKESDRVKFKGKQPTLQDLDTSLKLVHKLIRS